jgi:hypothetical protein
MTNERLQKFKNVEQISIIPDFCEQLVEAEKKFGKEIKNDFLFSRKEYIVFGTIFWLGKIGDWYFVGGEKETLNEFKFFQNKKMIQMYLASEFKGMDPEIKGFWQR